MKTRMTLATATVALLMALTTVSANASLVSPKAKDLVDSLARMPGTTADMIDRTAKNGSPKHVASIESLRKDSGTTPDVTRNVPTSTLKFFVR